MRVGARTVAGRLGASVLLALAGCSQPAPPAATPSQKPSEIESVAADVRPRITALRSDVAASPTDARTLRTRAASLYVWASDLARRGGQVPADLLATVAFIHAFEARVRNEASLAQRIDHWVAELALLEDSPGALGVVTASAGRFTAGEEVMLAQTWKLGSRSLQRGGSLMIRRQSDTDHGELQFVAPERAGYVSVQSSVAHTHWTPKRAHINAMRGIFPERDDVLEFHLDGADIPAGATITVTYGDRSAGGTGLRLSQVATDAATLPLLVDFEGDGNYMSLPTPPIAIVGGAAVAIAGVAPSVLARGETFTLSVRALDRFGNVAATPLPALTVARNGTPFMVLPASSDAQALISMRIDEVGISRLMMHAADGALTGVVNPVLVEAAPVHRVYWGDPGVRSALSGGAGTPASMVAYARDVARLDFIVHAEPDVGVDGAAWERLRDRLARDGGDGGLPAFLGYQWMQASSKGGYRTVLYRSPEARQRLSSIDFPTASDLFQGLRARYDTGDVLVLARAPEAADYRASDPELESHVEVASMSGSFEWFAQAWLQQGHQVGFVAASDDGFARPGAASPQGVTRAQRGGLTAVLAAEPTADALFTAMKQRQTYATTGERIGLSFTVNGEPMGGRTTFASERRLQGRVLGTAPVQSVTVLRNGEPIWSRDYLSGAADDGGRAATFHFEFSSPSLPVQPQDNPRGWRHWRGELKVYGARLVDVEGVAFRNPRLQRWIVDSETRNRAQFGTLTRGGSSMLAVTLADMTADARIDMTLDPAMETAESLALYRRARLVAPVDVQFRLSKVRAGVLAADVAFDGFADRVTLRRFDTPTHDVTFAVDDVSQRHGDNYFVRVQQADGAMAWSSPVWVGGHPPR